MTTHRVQMVLSERSFARLERLRTLTEAGSLSEVISNALRLYEFAIDRTLQGATILIQEDGQSPAVLKLFDGDEP